MELIQLDTTLENMARKVRAFQYEKCCTTAEAIETLYPKFKDASKLKLIEILENNIIRFINSRAYC